MAFLYVNSWIDAEVDFKFFLWFRGGNWPVRSHILPTLQGSLDIVGSCLVESSFAREAH